MNCEVKMTQTTHPPCNEVQFSIILLLIFIDFYLFIYLLYLNQFTEVH